MMKEKLYYLFTFLFLLTMDSVITSCSSDDDNPFIGRWEIVGIEEEKGITDYPYGNQTVSFYSNGIYAYTPNVVEYAGDSLFSWKSSGFVRKIKYSFNEQELYLYYDFEDKTDTYSYSFSDDNMTLRIICTKRGVGAIGCSSVLPDLLIGKTQVLKRLSD